MVRVSDDKAEENVMKFAIQFVPVLILRGMALIPQGKFYCPFFAQSGTAVATQLISFIPVVAIEVPAQKR